MYITSYNQLLVVFLYMRISYLINKNHEHKIIDIYFHLAIFFDLPKRFPRGASSVERAAALHELQKLRGFAAALDAAEMCLQETRHGSFGS